MEPPEPIPPSNCETLNGYTYCISGSRSTCQFLKFILFNATKYHEHTGLCFRLVYSTLSKDILNSNSTKFIFPFNSVEKNEIEFKFNKVHLSFQPVYSIWIHKLKRMKLNLNSTKFIFHFNLCIPFEYTSWRELNWIWIQPVQNIEQVEWRNFTEWNST